MPAVDRRANQRSRIRPARQPRSLIRLGLASVGIVVGLGLIVVAVASRRAEIAIDLYPSGPYRLHSSAGPLEVSVGPARLDYRASWLGHRPEVITTLDPEEPPLFAPDAPSRARMALDISCDTSLPCRASARLQLPPDSVVEATASGGPVLVERFDGTAAVVTSGDHDVVLGPVDGTIRVVTDRGDVTGHGLASRHVEVVTDGGAVHLDFRARPASVVVEAGDGPVVLVLPPGPYAVTVGGSPSAIIEVEQDESADSRISIDGHGPIRIASTP